MVEIYRIKSCLQDYPYTSKGDWEELTELERLAEIGRATEKAYSKGAFLIYDVVEDSQQNIISYNSDKDIEDLIDWAKED